MLPARVPVRVPGWRAGAAAAAAGIASHENEAVDLPSYDAKTFLKQYKTDIH